MNMKYKIESIGEIKSGEKNGEAWKTLDVVLVETEGQYPNSYVANMYKKGEYVKMVDGFATTYPIGTIVEAELKFRANKYTSKKTGKSGVIQNVSLWSIKKANETSLDTIEYPEEDINPEDVPF